jgi:hypothetical protein
VALYGMSVRRASAVSYKYYSHLYHSSKANCDCARARPRAVRIEIEKIAAHHLFDGARAHQLISERSIDDKIAGQRTVCVSEIKERVFFCMKRE